MPISKWADTEPDLQNEDFQTLVKLKLKRSILTGAFLLTSYNHTHSDQSRKRILFSAFLNNQSVCLFRDHTSNAFLESRIKQRCSSDTVQTQQFILLLLARFLPLPIWSPSTYLPVETGLEQTITSVNKMEKHFVQYFFFSCFSWQVVLMCRDKGRITACLGGSLTQDRLLLTWRATRLLANSCDVTSPFWQLWHGGGEGND